MRLDVLGIQAFLSIVERGSFQKAADDLNLSPTALSHRMKKLEADIGQRLIERTTREIKLTRAGSELLPRARESLISLGDAIDELRQKGDVKQNQLSFGCLPTIAENYLGDPLKKFAERHPAVAIRIYDNSAREIHELISKGEADFGITIVGTTSWDLEIETLMKEDFFFACSQNHPLAGEESVTWTQIAEQPMIRVSRLTGNRAIIDNVLGGRRENMNWLYEVQHNTTTVALVSAGVGCSILPSMALNESAHERIALVPLRQPSITRAIGFIWKRGEPLSPLASEFRELIAQELANLRAI